MVNKISSRVRAAILRGMGDLPIAPEEKAEEGEPE
jgi:hypothetical protein